MSRYAIIGLGRFGSRLATNLAAAGQEVLAIDDHEAIVEKLRDKVTMAVVMDATDEDALRALDVANVDAAVVGIGENFEANALITVMLKKMGVAKVVSRAHNPTTARILAGIGADEVVSPEDESADRWASRLVTPQFLSMLELGTEHAIVEVATPDKWAGKTLLELNLRAAMELHVVAIKRPLPSDQPGHWRVVMPRPQEPLLAQDTLVIMGRDADLARIPRDEAK